MRSFMLPQRKSPRMKGFDYSKDNLYFVTSCVKDMVCCFGEVVDKKMILNAYGLIANAQWKWLVEQYQYAVSHQFVVMPNHMHGLIEIDRSVIDLVGSGRDLNATKIKSLSQLMGAYKTTVSKQIHLLGYNEFQWQRSFHDHIVRDGNAYDNIANYIINNPAKWNGDKFYKTIK